MQNRQVAAATGTVKGFEHPDQDLSVRSRPNALVLFNPVYDNSKEGYGFERVAKYWKEFSPRHNIDKNTPPMIVFFGEKEVHVKVDVAEKIKEEMNDLGVKSELYIHPDLKHSFFNYGRDGNKWFLETMNKTHKFLTGIRYITVS